MEIKLHAAKANKTNQPTNRSMKKSKRKSEQQFSSVQLNCLVMCDSLWPHGLQNVMASLSITNSWSLLKLISIETVMLSSHLMLCCPLLLQPSLFLSIRVSSNESVLCIRWPKYWSFNFSISPFSGKIDWFDLHTVQEVPRSLLWHHSSKASILWHSAFFIVQLLHPYITTGKTTALTIWPFVRKVLFKTLSLP